VTRLQTGKPGSHDLAPSKGKRFLFALQQPVQLCGPLSPLTNRFQAVKLITPVSHFEVRGQLYCTIKFPRKFEECNCTEYARFEVLMGMMKP